MKGTYIILPLHDTSKCSRIHFTALKEYEPRVASHCAELLTQLITSSQNGTNPIEITRWFNYYSFDVMGDLAFGKSFNMVRDGDAHFVLTQLEAMKPIAGSLTCVPWTFILLHNLPVVRGKRAEWVNWCKGQVEERKKVYCILMRWYERC